MRPFRDSRDAGRRLAARLEHAVTMPARRNESLRVDFRWLCPPF